MRLGPVLIVIAHPGDESLFGGILGRMRELGVRCHCLCATRGESSPANYVTGSLDELIEIRPRELLEAARRLGIEKVIQLDFPDVPFLRPGTDEPITDVKEILDGTVWDFSGLEQKIEAAARDLEPEVVLTLMPDHPLIHLSHPHHKAVANVALKLAREGRLGSQLGALLASPERRRYPLGSLAPQEGEIFFPLEVQSPGLGCTYSEFQEYGAQAHVSQLTAHLGAATHDESLVPIWVKSELTIHRLTDVSFLYRDSYLGIESEFSPVAAPSFNRVRAVSNRIVS